MKTLEILVVEDERTQREMLRDFLIKEGFRVAEAADGAAAIDRIRSGPVDLALVDYRMPGMSGREVLDQAKRIDPQLDVVILTAYGTVETAVEAMKAGACDYLTKPIDLDELLLVIERIAERKTLLRENEMLRQELKEKTDNKGDIVYRSLKMAELINLSGRIAKSQANVLIKGESGTGKELLARLIHNLSDRAGNALIAVNCAALPETLIESELFGHEKGAFTGAVQRRIGRFEQADKGTLFLDEIGELAPSVQVKLLRFLQEGEYQRVGGDRPLAADVRVISATNRDLEAGLKDGSFREDLFFRLNVIPMTVPPLRERREDIPPLVDHFVKRFAEENRKRIEGVSREAMNLLSKYDYPGNVRELENIIERAVVISREALISVRDLPFKAEMVSSAGAEKKAQGTLRKAAEALERQMIREAMEEKDGNQSRAADVLGISERMLRYKLKKFRLK
ncbi:MAG: sigma-54-dependent Fis family transcriptional regulator [Desulfobacteraceae bacterium]|nr:MAG: sigma-54-dependent Fis family transcriptional regulator [Desulfobacteraceae bacterium]